MKLLDMESAPKDGTKILVKERVFLDHTDFEFRVVWWWKPTELHQWESGACPHWEYITNQGCFSANSERLLGWMPLPAESLSEK